MQTIVRIRRGGVTEFRELSMNTEVCMRVQTWWLYYTVGRDTFAKKGIYKKCVPLAKDGLERVGQRGGVRRHQQAHVVVRSLGDEDVPREQRPHAHQKQDGVRDGVLVWACVRARVCVRVRMC